MGTHYRRYEPGQPFLAPPSPCDWLPENHLTYFIAGTLDQLNLRALHKRCQGAGRRNRPCHPAMMLKLLVHACATGVFCSRKVARKIDEDAAFRVLPAGKRPDFRTINRFRAQQLDEFNKLLVEIVRLVQPTG